MATAGASSFEDEIMESDIELEGEAVEPDNDPPQKVGDLWNANWFETFYDVCLMVERIDVLIPWLFLLQMGDPSVEVSDEKRDQAQLCKNKGVDAFSEGKVYLPVLIEISHYNKMNCVILCNKVCNKLVFPLNQYGFVYKQSISLYQVNWMKLLSIWQRLLYWIRLQLSPMQLGVPWLSLYMVLHFSMYRPPFDGNQMSLFCYAAVIFVKSKKPNAAIRDADAALKVWTFH